ncbi:MAG: MFS transporter [Actinomycetota bacterium]
MRLRRRRARLITPAFLMIAGASLMYFTAAGLTLPGVPRYVEGPLGGTNTAVGLAVGSFSLTAVLFRPWAGRLGDRRGRRLVMVGGAATVGLSALGYMVPSLAGLVAFRLLSGLGEAFFFTGAAAAIADLAPEERRGEAVSFFTLSLYLGIGIGPFLGELLIDKVGFEETWLVTAALCAAATLLALFVPETRPPGTAEHRSTKLIHPSAILPGTALLTSVWAQAALFSFMPLYALTLKLEGARYVFIMYAAIVVLIRLFGARIPDVVGPVRASRVALAFSTLGLTVVALWRAPAGLYVGTAVLAVGASLAFPALMTLAIRGTDPAERGAVLGTFGAFVDVAFGLGPATLGVLGDALGYRGLFLSAAAVTSAGLVLLLRSHRRPASA